MTQFSQKASPFQNWTKFNLKQPENGRFEQKRHHILAHEFVIWLGKHTLDDESSSHNKSQQGVFIEWYFMK